MIYAIRYTELQHGALNARNRYGIRVLRHLSSLTGGADFNAGSTDLARVFAQIGEELRSMYRIGYLASAAQPHDGAFHKITIRLKIPDATVRTKSGYYAH